MIEDPPLSYEELVSRLAVAEQTLAAIRHGEVDALIVSVEGAVRVYTLEGADAFYRVLVEHMPEGAAAVSADGLVLYANTCLAEMLGAPLESLIGAELPSFVAPELRPQLRQLLTRDGDGEAVDFVLQRTDGADVHAAVSVNPVDGHALSTRCVVVVDLTRRRLAEDALREAEARFRGAFDNAPIGMALLDLDGAVRQVNPALCALAGVPERELVGHPLPWLAGPDVSLDDVDTASGRQLSLERRVPLPDGSDQWIAVQVTLLRSREGEPLQLIVQVQDESERRRHEQQLLHVADHDGLTGLLNRRGFDRALEHHVGLVQRYGADGAILLFDVDHFKYINDTHGHVVGDGVLHELASVLTTRLRETDILARLGGDEFAVLLQHGTASVAASVAEDLLQAVRAIELPAFGGTRRLSVSIGVVGIVDTSMSPGEMMALADLAMYDSKERGRDQATVHDATPGRSTTGIRLSWLSRIEAALANETLLLAAQPIVDLATGAVIGQELLVRLPDPTGPVAASRWFPVAERYGLAPAIDEWLVDRALELLASGSYPALNVNVSAKSIGRQAWRERVHAGLASTGVAPERLTFEITETAAIDNIPAAVRFTEDLRSMGCRLALDDFGAGFGSFYYLKHLPFDDVKIDGEFVRDCVNNDRDRAIIRSMVDVARSMGRRTVAECIEDEETLRLVRAHGVDMAQGYHLGRPAPVVLPVRLGLKTRATSEVSVEPRPQA